MNGPHRPCTYRMGVVGDRCRHWGEESRKKSTVVGDQRDKQEWKRWTALRQRHASPGNLTNGDYLTQTLRNTHCQKELHLLPEHWIIVWQALHFFEKTRVQYYFGPSVSHRECGIAILLSEVVKGPGYWKFNNSLLEDINYVNQTNEVTDSFIRGDNTANQDQQSWQLLKLRIKQLWQTEKFR